MQIGFIVLLIFALHVALLVTLVIMAAFRWYAEERTLREFIILELQSLNTRIKNLTDLG
jgi:hypothetical protein